MDQWLISGMDRSLFAEYRAWLTTVIVYQEGLGIQGLWDQVPWLEESLLQRHSDLPLEDRIFLNLDQNSQNPHEVLRIARDQAIEETLDPKLIPRETSCDGDTLKINFQSPALLSRLKALREEYRTFQRRVDLGTLSQIIYAPATISEEADK